MRCQSSHLQSHRTLEGDAGWCQRIQSTSIYLVPTLMSGTIGSPAFLICRKRATVKVVTKWYHVLCGKVSPLLPVLVINLKVNASSISRLQ